MSILVTGGAGYVGSTVIKQLIGKGENIVSFDNLYKGSYKYLSEYDDNSQLKMEIGNIESLNELRRCLANTRDLEAIIHLAAIPGLDKCLEDPKRSILTNVLGTFNIMEIAREHKVKKIIFASSAAVFGVPKIVPIDESHPTNPMNLYGITKLTGENIINSHSAEHVLNSVILRFGNIYGVGVFTYWETVIPRFVKLALEEQPITIYGEGTQGRDFIHVRDISNAIILCLKHETYGVADYNLGTGETFSVRNISDIIAETLKKEHNKTLKTVNLPARKGEPYVEDFRYSITKIIDEIGFKPKWSLRDGIRQTIDYYLQTHQK